MVKVGGVVGPDVVGPGVVAAAVVELSPPDEPVPLVVLA